MWNQSPVSRRTNSTSSRAKRKSPRADAPVPDGRSPRNATSRRDAELAIPRLSVSRISAIDAPTHDRCGAAGTDSAVHLGDRGRACLRASSRRRRTSPNRTPATGGRGRGGRSRSFSTPSGVFGGKNSKLMSCATRAWRSVVAQQDRRQQPRDDACRRSSRRRRPRSRRHGSRRRMSPTNQNSRPLMTKMKRPSVSSVAGSVRMTRIGRITVLMRPRISAATSAVDERCRPRSTGSGTERRATRLR